MSKRLHSDDRKETDDDTTQTDEETNRKDICIDTEDFQGKISYYEKRDYKNNYLITSESEGAFILSSEDKKSIYVYQVLDETDTDSALVVQNNRNPAFRHIDKIPWSLSSYNLNNLIKIPTSYCYKQEHFKYKEPKHEEENNHFVGGYFRPDPHQMHSLKYAGEKIMLGHRPGFGKTINAILLAERQRNAAPEPKPKIYVVAPDRKLVKQWVGELQRLGVDTSHYIWSTYKHFELSQAKMEYPEWDSLTSEQQKQIESAPIEGERGKNPTKQYYRYCSCSKKPYTLQEAKKIFPDQAKELEAVWNGVTHTLYDDKGNKYRMRLYWGLMEDKIYFNCCKKVFVTGFTPRDVGYDTYELHEANEGMSISQYLQQEKRKFENFKKVTKETSKTVEGTLRVPYMYENGFKLHMYRAPQNCITIFDEIHKYAKQSKSLILQTLWKYILGCKHTILLTATPVESSGSELYQLYLMSELLRTKRDFSNKSVKALNGRSYRGDFLPPWNILADTFPKGENMYEIASRLKYKFSRFNTVQDVENSIDALYQIKTVGKEFEMDDTKLMNTYLGISSLKKSQWIAENESRNGAKLNYRINKDYYNLFVREALKKLYVKQSQSREKVFPDLEPYGNGIIEVPLDKHRVYMKDVNPQYVYLNSLEFDGDVKIRNGRITVIQKENGEHGVEEIKQTEKAVLSNKTNGFFYFTEQPLIASYSDSTDLVLPARSIPRKPLTDGKQGLEHLQWLYVHPTRCRDDSFYEGIPYVPGLLGNKVMEIVCTIENQVRMGKNVMVYHDKVEMLRMVQRGLAMRGHVMANEMVKTGDSKLQDHAKEQASKRFVRLPKQYIEKQKKAYEYGDISQDKSYTNFDQLKEVYEKHLEMLKLSSFAMFYRGYENKFTDKDAKELGICYDLLEFGYYAEYVHHKKVDDRPVFKKLLDGLGDIGKLKSKINFQQKKNIMDCITLLLEWHNKDKSMDRQIICDYCCQEYKKNIDSAEVKNKNLHRFLKENQIPIPTDVSVKERAFKYYISRAWTDVRNNMWKSSQLKWTEKKDRQTDKMRYAHEQLKTLKKINEFAMPTIDWDYTSFLNKHDNIFGDPFFDSKQKGATITLNQLDFGSTTFETFPRSVSSNKDVFHFCGWTRMYFKHLYDKHFQGTKEIKIKDLDSIDKYYDAILHLAYNPDLSKKKKSIIVGGQKQDKRETFVDEMLPRITGMAKKDRMFYGVLEGQNKTTGDQEKFQKSFEHGEIDCLLVSESGIVGLDYKSCSPSFMICIDPVKSAGKQDQFNGRTVRRGSHKNLPEDMRKVQYVSFSTKGLEKPKNIEKNTDALDPSLRQLLKNGTDRALKSYRLRKRSIYASKESERLDKIIEEIKSERPLDTEVLLKHIRLREFYNLDDNDRRWYHQNIDEFKSLKLADYAESAKNIEDRPISEPRDVEFTTMKKLKKELQQDEYLSEFELRTKYIKLETEFSLGKKVLKILKKINKLRETLRRRFGYKLKKITKEDQLKRNKLYLNKEKRIVMPWEEELDETIVEQDVNLKKWDFYFDNFVNISHIPVYNNHAFLCMKHYNDVKEELDLNTIRCYACNQDVKISERCINCKFKHKENGKFLYYHLHDIKSITEDNIKKYSVKKYISLNKRSLDVSEINRVQRDRIEMALTMNSIDHLARLSGPSTFKFQCHAKIKKKTLENKITFYKHIDHEVIPASDQDWNILKNGVGFKETSDYYRQFEKEKEDYVHVKTPPQTPKQKRKKSRQTLYEDETPDDPKDSDYETESDESDISVQEEY